MGRKTVSVAHKKRRLRAEHDAQMATVISTYRNQSNLNPSQQLSIQAIAITNKVSPSTLGRLLNGGILMAEFNQQKRHFMHAEHSVFINSIKDRARQGFPLTHRLLEECANTILHVWKGSTFKVGRAWVSRFLKQHADELSVYYNNLLDRLRASGLNSMAVGWYFNTLKQLQQDHNMPTENWYGANESGVAMGITSTAEVIGPAGQKLQHQQQDGEREIVTVLESICANGSVLKPTIVFKGKNLLTNSLKHHWQVFRNAQERSTGLPVKKEDFIALYSMARSATMRAALIIEAFRKTGAHPINRNAVSAEQMAPSYETSIQIVFPANLASPVKAVLAAHHNARATPALAHSSSESMSSISRFLPLSTPSNPILYYPAPFEPLLYSLLKRAIVMNFLLEQTSANHLVAVPGAKVDALVGGIPDAVYKRSEASLYPNWSIL